MFPKRYTQTQRRDFQEFFGVPLADYWDGITGFDVVKFDEEVIMPPDGTSTRDAIAAKQGMIAVALIHQLIGA